MSLCRTLNVTVPEGHVLVLGDNRATVGMVVTGRAGPSCLRMKSRSGVLAFLTLTAVALSGPEPQAATFPVMARCARVDYAFMRRVIRRWRPVRFRSNNNSGVADRQLLWFASQQSRWLETQDGPELFGAPSVRHHQGLPKSRQDVDGRRRPVGADPAAAGTLRHPRAGHGLPLHQSPRCADLRSGPAGLPRCPGMARRTKTRRLRRCRCCSGSSATNSQLNRRLGRRSSSATLAAVDTPITSSRRSGCSCWS